ncbi:hypothetical protein ASPACDRAFT_46510 [Aspergillus aculeatus ATCC 16872]|uniref:Uncharacterized protein n=1 Tax=Aspergillus aculeatus (strain ATCC 16872 / CBS 172.66 / WB 5094) TaxID=690307 RepID=A0A1L9WLE9_ASPA1|nr:uncharacterized protein ASPACDRAFT_46510 [Aspergillus aculeatus ATCC 16872]OJJ96986.1 hypothetical protein ASPACDRAFT_46510 [Aspergillus aculeatus ATCC 16872]
MLSLPDTFTQFTELGEADIGTLHGDHVSVVVIHIKNARFLMDDWAPAVQILQDQWHGKRQQQQQRYPQPDGKPLGGVLSTRDSCRFYTEPTAGDGPPQRLEYQGRSEFVPPVNDEHPEVFLAFLRTCLDGLGASGFEVDVT